MKVKLRIETSLDGAGLAENGGDEDEKNGHDDRADRCRGGGVDVADPDLAEDGHQGGKHGGKQRVDDPESHAPQTMSGAQQFGPRTHARGTVALTSGP